MTKTNRDSLRRKHASVWVGAVIVGLAAVLYAKMISFAQGYYLRWFHSHSFIVSLGSPIGFIAATFLVRKFAPEAKGIGIPQVLQAIHTSKVATRSKAIWHASRKPNAAGDGFMGDWLSNHSLDEAEQEMSDQVTQNFGNSSKIHRSKGIFYYEYIFLDNYLK